MNESNSRTRFFVVLRSSVSISMGLVRTKVFFFFNNAVSTVYNMLKSWRFLAPRRWSFVRIRRSTESSSSVSFRTFLRYFHFSFRLVYPVRTHWPSFAPFARITARRWFINSYNIAARARVWFGSLWKCKNTKPCPAPQTVTNLL